MPNLQQHFSFTSRRLIDDKSSPLCFSLRCSDICTHSAGATLALATERDMKDAAAEEVTLEGATFALSSKRGRRRNSVCEDAYRAAPGLDGDPTQGIFSVFDGHGGRAAAEYAAEHLHTNILSEVHADPVAGADLEGSIDAVKAAMIRGFLATDRGFLAEGTRSGATATTAYMRGGVVWVANVGDCRAVVSEGGVAAALTRDHRPDRAEERRLVERRGGEVVCILGTSRVQGVLGVSRAIGDKDLKQYITAEPEVYAGPISDVAEFLIIGTDGLWDVVGNQEAIDVVRDCLGLATVSEGAAGAAGVGVGVGSGGGAGAGAVAPREKSPTSPDRVGGAAAPPPPDWGDSRGAEDGSPGGSGSGGSGGSGGGELEGPRGANLRAGPTDRACKALVEMARARGSRDDISVLIVELSTYAQGGTPVSTPGDDASDSAGSPNVSTPQPSPSSGSGGGSGKTGAGGGKADGGVAGQAA